MNAELIPLLIFRSLTVLAGSIFLAYTAQAYVKHRSRSMLILATAIGLMVLAVLGEGIAYFIFGATLGLAETVEAGITLLAFLVLLWSIRMHAPKN